MRSMLSRVVFVVCLWVAIMQMALAQAPVTPNYQFTNGAGSATIPFDLSSNLIFLNTEVNDSKPLPFALDNGIAATLVDEKTAQALNLDAAAPGLDYTLPGFELMNESSSVTNLSKLSPVLGRHISGIIGSGLFKRFVVAVDYQKQTVTISDPRSFQYDGMGRSLPLVLKDHTAYVDAQLVGAGHAPVAARLKIDTGSADGIDLDSAWVREAGLISPGQKSLEEPAAITGRSRTVTRIDELRIGPYLLKRPLVEITGGDARATSEGVAGLIGGDVLRRFTVIFDYPAKKLILEPNSKYGSEPFDYDAGGLLVLAEGADLTALTVRAVVPGGPADDAGVRAGDVIAAIDDQSASDITLDDLRKVLKLAGRQFKLQIVRHGKTIRTTIRLRPRI